MIKAAPPPTMLAAPPPVLQGPADATTPHPATAGNRSQTYRYGPSAMPFEPSHRLSTERRCRNRWRSDLSHHPKKRRPML